MKNYQETMEILKEFYEDCVRFHEKENPKLAKVRAIKDLYSVQHNPFSPVAVFIDPTAKADFIEQKTSELI